MWFLKSNQQNPAVEFQKEVCRSNTTGDDRVETRIEKMSEIETNGVRIDEARLVRSGRYLESE